MSPIVLLIICAILSGEINGNSPFITTLGTFDYVKNFLAIFIYAAFFNDPAYTKKIYHLLLIVALCIATVALVQFLWAMGSVYIFNKDITDPSVYIFRSNNPAANAEMIWRFGIYSANNAYILGLYCLLMLTIYFYRSKNKSILIIFMLLAGTLASGSRMAYGGLIFVMSIQVNITRV